MFKTFSIMYHNKVSVHGNLLEISLKLCWGGSTPLNFLSPHRAISINISELYLARFVWRSQQRYQLPSTRIRRWKKSCIKHEVQVYLIDTDNNKYLSPLKWWRVNGEISQCGDRKRRTQSDPGTQYESFWSVLRPSSIYFHVSIQSFMSCGRSVK